VNREGGAYDLAALVLDVLLGLLEVVVGGILCEGDLGRLVGCTTADKGWRTLY
jgi:hypothetical protein